MAALLSRLRICSCLTSVPCCAFALRYRFVGKHLRMVMAFSRNGAIGQTSQRTAAVSGGRALLLHLTFAALPLHLSPACALRLHSAARASVFAYHARHFHALHSRGRW